VFPQLATLTASRCMDPLYQYVLCETEGGEEPSEEQSNRFVDGFRRTPAEFTRLRTLRSPRVRPTSALLALQPHLPSGYLELPLSALTVPSPNTRTVTTSNTSASSPAMVASASTNLPYLLVALAAGSVELFRSW
jgi:hypothetical protein